MSKAEVYKRDGGRCFYCHKDLTIEEASLEHILSKSKGGSNDNANCTISCKDCNLEAGSLSVVKKISIRDEKLSKVWADSAVAKENLTRKKITRLTVGTINIEIEE